MKPTTHLLTVLVGLVAAVAGPAQGLARDLPRLDDDPVRSGSYTSPRIDAGAPHPGRFGPLTDDERRMASAAWRYFTNNTQSSTGLVNAADGYPSTTLWDTASAMGAIVSAEGLGLIARPEAQARLARIIDTLAQVSLFRGTCPNKAYNSVSGEKVTYTNQPGEIGCSALDVGRAMLWMRVVQQRYPDLASSAARAVAHWQPERLVREGRLFGTGLAPDGSVQFLQEGRLGYEEYGAKGFRLWGFDTREAARPEPYGLISLFNVRLPYDARDPRVERAHNYVVTESYVLDGIEYGWDEADDVTSDPFVHTSGWIARSAQRIYLAQQRRFEQTGVLTARTEHQLAGAPYFVYDTLYSDGHAWATITDTGEDHPEVAAVASKGAIGLWALWSTPYTDRLFHAVKGAIEPTKGIDEGLLEKDGSRIGAFTANNNGIILESLLYKVTGKILRPDADNLVPLRHSAEHLPRRPDATAPLPPTLAAAPKVTAAVAAAIPPQVAMVSHGLSDDDRAMATVAWQYFRNNTQSATGLINAVDGYPATTLWDLAAGLGAIVAAQRMDIIDRQEAIDRLRRVIATLNSLRLFRGVCPNKVYDTRDARPTNYANQPGEIGCSALDLGRLLVWMKVVQQRYPELRSAIDAAVRHWNVPSLVRNGEMFGAVPANQGGVRFLQEGRLGYEEYAAKGYRLWGYDTAAAMRPDPFDVVDVEGVAIMHDRRSETTSGGLNAVVTENFVLDGVEFGFSDPTTPNNPSPGWLKTQADNVVLAQQKRYERTGILTARTEHQLSELPNFVYDTIWSEGTTWATQTVTGKDVHGAAALATKAALGIWALWPGTYGDKLRAAVRHTMAQDQGFYEGILEKGGMIRALTANTNGIILEILLYRLTGPILRAP